MSIATIANNIHQTVSSVLWTVRDVAVADKIGLLSSGVDAAELYCYNCLHFGRQYNAAFFMLSSSLWRRFSLSDWAKVVAGVHPRPEPLWAWDGGHFADVSFLIGRLQIDALEVARSIAHVEADELRKIAGYGAIHAELLVPNPEDSTDDGEEADEYELILLSAVSEARSHLLGEAPVLDLSQVSALELRERLVGLLRR